jgi:chaperonin cofactor prefoldin
VIELPLVKFGVELFEKFLKSAREAEKDKREKFERTCKPLYEKLEPIANEYFLAIEEAVRGLKKPNASLADLSDNIAKRRAALIIARDGIVGQADAFQDKFGELAHKDEYARRALTFASSISSYFNDAGSAIFGGPTTAIQGLLIDIGEMKDLNVADKAPYSQRLKELTERAEKRVETLKAKWKEVGKNYKALQLLCEP